MTALAGVPDTRGRAAPGRTGPSPVRRIDDRAEWNHLVQQFDAHDFRQGFEWGEVRRAQGWAPARFAVFQDGDCVAACALMCRSLPGLGAVLYAPRGPLFHVEEPEALARLLDTLRDFGATRRAIFLRMSPGIESRDTTAVACLARHGLVTLDEPWTTWNTPRYVQVLDLEADEQALRARVRRRMRGYISAAPRNGLCITASEREDDLPAFHALMVNAGRLKGFPVRDLAYYRALFRHYRLAGGITLLTARAGDAVVGGLLAVRFGSRAHVLYTSVRSGRPEPNRSTAGMRHHVAPAISWEFVRRARAEGCTLADFGGSGVSIPPRETDAGWGVYHFKAGLGCTLETFVPFHDLVLRPALYQLVRLSEAKVLPKLWTFLARRPPIPRTQGASA
jgi:lipid II:glycine glycyltransferase (peptidoglycan interpeptide bridge formation enzyme)